MKDFDPSLYIEVNTFNINFFVREKDNNNNFVISYRLDIPLAGVENNIITNYEKFLNLIKENVYLIEQKSKHTFKETILILENFNPIFLNLAGFKKLNGSQILRENITYILNTLKSYVINVEKDKTILHMFNSNFNLDKKKIYNLPIGLFGNFYSQELSLIMIDKNNYRNLKNIFDKCNLKIKKIFFKSFIKCANISNSFKDYNTFFHLCLNNNDSKVLFLENNSLKSEQNFKFGIEIIIRDICKITSLKEEMIMSILQKEEFREGMPEDDYIDEEFFQSTNFRKIKKKLIYEIIFARVKELVELMLFENKNYEYYRKFSINLIIEINTRFKFKSLEDIIKKITKSKGKFNINFNCNFSDEIMLGTADKLVHFGWDKEAIPVTQPKKSIIARFFEAIFQ